MKLLNLVFMFVVVVTSRQYNTSSSRQASAALNVHIVCHTHDDVGWLKTYTQYFYGSNQTYAPTTGAVQFIIDTVVTSLAKNNDRKFIYVEQAYFMRWYEQQDEDTVALVKKLVQTKQLEFINGGWVMHDEASTHFIGMLDQTTYGHQKIFKNFGAVPVAGWQIDPFGHSATQASLLSADVGFESLFFARIDYQDKKQRYAKKDLEFFWQSSPLSSPNSTVFTGVFAGGYGSPGGFCFDTEIGCIADPPLIDDKDDPEYNIPMFVEKFVGYALGQQTIFKGNDIMTLMGTDFMYDNAERWFANLDKLIHYVNLDGRINVFYSTPSIYAHAKKTSPGVVYSTKTDDFFPYADGPESYWTGYFTSRPALKRMERASSGYLQSARILEVQGKLDTSRNFSSDALDELDRAVAVVQHHDGVSGTSKQHVAYDYALQISKGLDRADVLLAQVSADLIGSPVPGVFCRLLNETSCPFSENSTRFAVVLHNAQAHTLTSLIRLPILASVSMLEVRNYNGSLIPSQLTNESIPLLEHRQNPAPQRLILSFEATIPSLGFSTFFVQPPSSSSTATVTATATVTVTATATATVTNAATPKTAKFLQKEKGTGDKKEEYADEFIVIENNQILANFSALTGSLVSVTNKIDNVKMAIKQEWLYYISAEAELDGYKNQSSGAYIFRPSERFPHAINVHNSGSPPIAVTVSRGPVVQEVRIEINKWISQSVRLRASAAHLESEMTVGPIPTEKCEKLCGLEVITRYTTDLATQNIFYTDSNGREMQKRVLNQRPSWNLTVTEPVAGNYYPVNVAAALRSPSAHFTVVVDRSLGAASLASGQMEFMLHRRINYDDKRGVDEFLDETEGPVAHSPLYAHHFGPGLTIVTTHLLSLSSPAIAPQRWRNLAVHTYSPPVPAFYSLPLVPKRAQHSYLQLPDFVSLLTFQLLEDCSVSACVRIRLWHTLAQEEAQGPINIDLSSLFAASGWPASIKIVNITETSLTANQIRGPIPVGVIVLNPMQIRTFTFALQY